jgi:hypothetical protein
MQHRDSLGSKAHSIADLAFAAMAGAAVIALLPFHFAILGIKALLRPSTPSAERSLGALE